MSKIFTVVDNLRIISIFNNNYRKYITIILEKNIRTFYHFPVGMRVIEYILHRSSSIKVLKFPESFLNILTNYCKRCHIE